MAAKLTDFGIARLVDSDRMTMQGFTVGTANYLSPEQATGEEVGPPADVYSLGLVLLECLTGVVAYPGNGVAAASARLHRQPAIPELAGPAVGVADRRDDTTRPGAAHHAAHAAAELSPAARTQSPVDRTRVLETCGPRRRRQVVRSRRRRPGVVGGGCRCARRCSSLR